jgi:hypothetical protein
MLKGALAAALGGVAAHFRGGVADAATTRQACARLTQSCATTPCCAGMVCDEGVCYRALNASCYADSECGADTVCRPTPHGLGQRCLPAGVTGDACVDAADCAANYACNGGVCLPGFNTLAAWDGSSQIRAFGWPNTATYGQTITVPAGVNQLDSFAIMMQYPPAGVFRGEVYAWDAVNNRATGAAVWESAPTSTASANAGLVTFLTGGVPVVAGQQYVLFTSISKDYAANNGVSTGGWGYNFVDLGVPGGFVYLNDTGDAGSWTTTTWSTDYAYGDANFSASFSVA